MIRILRGMVLWEIVTILPQISFSYTDEYVARYTLIYRVYLLLVYTFFK